MKIDNCLGAFAYCFVLLNKAMLVGNFSKINNSADLRFWNFVCGAQIFKARDLTLI